MSGEVALWAARQDITNHTAKMVLIALGDAFNDNTGRCFPSHEAIGDFVRRSNTRIRDAIRWLEDNGWIKREARHSQKGRQQSNDYEIIFERGESFLDMVARRRKIRGDDGGNPGGGGNPTGDQKRSGEVTENGHPGETESGPPRTESLDNKGAQARDDENLDVKEGVNWRNRLVQYRIRANWAPNWGPFMGKPGCLVPAHLVAEWSETKGEAFTEEKQARKPQTEAKSWTKRMRGTQGEAERRRNLPGTSHD